MPRLMLAARGSDDDADRTGGPAAGGAGLLDAYSRAVTGAVDKVAPAVVHLRVAGQHVKLARRLVRLHGLAQNSGVRVASLEPGSPAAQAGLRPGDVIVGLDEHAIAGIDALHRLLSVERVGRPCRVTILRGTEKLALVLVPVERSGR